MVEQYGSPGDLERHHQWRDRHVNDNGARCARPARTANLALLITLMGFTTWWLSRRQDDDTQESNIAA